MADKSLNNAVVPTREQGNVSLQCPRLTISNYTTWAILMGTILKACDLWDTVVPAMATIVDETKANTAKAVIFQILLEDVLLQVAQHDTAKDVWDSIKIQYLGAGFVQKARLQILRSEL
jgi:hypothetical protein